MDGDHVAVVGDADLARADPGVHPQPDQGDRDRVAVLADRDHRLGIDARRGLFGRLEALARQRAQQPPLAVERLPDRPRPAADRALEIGPAPLLHALVELGQRVDLRDRNQVATAEAPDLAFDAALLMRAALPRLAEARLEHVVRPERDETVGLDPPAALENLRDRRAQVVVADDVEGAAEPLQREDVGLQERLLGLALERHHERRAREARAHHEHVHPRPLPAQQHRGLAPVDLRLDPGLGDQRHIRLAELAQLAPALADIARDLALRHHRPVLLHQPLPDPARRVTAIILTLAKGRP